MIIVEIGQKRFSMTSTLTIVIIESAKTLCRYPKSDIIFTCPIFYHCIIFMIRVSTHKLDISLFKTLTMMTISPNLKIDIAK